MMELVVPVLAATVAFLLAHYVTARFRGALAVARMGEDRRSRPRRGALVDAWVRRVQHMVPNAFDSRVRRAIVMAGGLEGLSAAELVLWALLAGAGAFALGMWFALATGWSIWMSVAGFVLGAVYPFVWLRDKVKQRHLAILQEMPYQLDLLTLSVEAGLDFIAGLGKVVERGKEGPMRDELARMLAEIRVGKSRSEAMGALAHRVGLPALSNFLSAMIQADRLGTGLGRTLRIQADQLRNERFQRAEKAAGEAPVKMLIPLVVFVFPTIWIILAGPLVFDWLYSGG
ncbi:MAG: type II secretion system F family protein [Myxococcota bacterium]